jgi:uncharacterized membrane protein YhaH (DUF805 family)
MFMPLKRYADFSGRSRRREYWMWMIFILVVQVVLYGLTIGAASNAGGEMTSAVAVPFGALLVFLLAILIPSMAVSVRRLHDQDRSGLYLLLGLVPIAGPLAVLVLMSRPGSRGPNRYGPDPRSGGGPWG